MSLYKQSGSPNWHANISVPGKPRIRRSTGTEDRVQAQQIHDQWKAELWNLKPAPKGATWSAAIELWLDAEERSDSELYSLKKLSARYADRPVSECTADSLERALSFCRTAGTYTRYRTMVTAILNMAKGKDWIDKVPVLAVKKDKKKKPRKWLTREQWAKLYAELPPHMKPMAEFAILTGLRQSNVLGLRWEQIDLQRKFLWIEAQEMKDDDALPVPLSKRACEILAERRAAQENDEYVFTYRGKPIKDVKTAFIAACIRAGLGSYRRVESGVRNDRATPGRDNVHTGKERSALGPLRYEGFTWHGLRHTWATWHVQKETPLDVLQKLGGWSDPRMVQNYAHHSAKHLARYVDTTERPEKD